METGLLSQPSTPQAISSHESSPPLTNLRDLGVILTENNTTDHMDIEFDLDKLNARNQVLYFLASAIVDALGITLAIYVPVYVSLHN